MLMMLHCDLAFILHLNNEDVIITCWFNNINTSPDHRVCLNAVLLMHNEAFKQIVYSTRNCSTCSETIPNRLIYCLTITLTELFSRPQSNLKCHICIGIQKWLLLSGWLISSAIHMLAKLKCNTFRSFRKSFLHRVSEPSLALHVQVLLLFVKTHLLWRVLIKYLHIQVCFHARQSCVFLPLCTN